MLKLRQLKKLLCCCNTLIRTIFAAINYLKNEKSRDQKKSRAKKNYYSLIANSNDRNRSQFGQALDWSSKKNFCPNKGGQQS